LIANITLPRTSIGWLQIEITHNLQQKRHEANQWPSSELVTVVLKTIEPI